MILAAALLAAAGAALVGQAPERRSLELDLGANAQALSANEPDPVWGVGQGQWRTLQRADGVNVRLLQFRPKTSASAQSLSTYLKTWRATHACMAREVANFPATQGGSTPIPQLTFRGECKAGDSFIIRALVVDGAAYELHVDTQLRAPGAAIPTASPTQLDEAFSAWATKLRMQGQRWVKPVSLHDLSATGVTLDVETEGLEVLAVSLAGPAGPKAVSDASPRRRHRLALSGLRPDSVYDYEVRWGGPNGSIARGRFQTALPPGTSKPFTFAVAGDSRNHASWARVAAAILEKSPRFLLCTGDSVNSDSAEDWRDFYVAGEALFARVPVFAVRGNHDPLPSFTEYNLPPSGALGPSTYGFEFGNAAFVAIDSNTPTDAAQQAFVDSALKRYSGRPLFAFQHHPLFSCGLHGSSTVLQDAFRPLFERWHVTADFAGHDHDLIEWKPEGTVRYFVSGGGGTTLYPLVGCEGQPFAERSRGFALVEVEGAQVTVTFFDDQGIELHSSGRIPAHVSEPPGPH